MIIPLPAGVKPEAVCGACSNMIRVPQVEEKEQSRIPCFSKVITFPAAGLTGLLLRSPFLNYYNEETLLFTVYLHYGNSNLRSSTTIQLKAAASWPEHPLGPSERLAPFDCILISLSSDDVLHG